MFSIARLTKLPGSSVVHRGLPASWPPGRAVGYVANRRPARPGQVRQVIDAWLAAAEQGDFTALLGLLDEHAVLRAEYGTHRQIINGARAVAEQAALSARLAAHSIRIRVGGRPGVAAVINGRLVSIMAFTLAEASIARLDVLADPVKLQELRAASVVEMGGLS